MLPTITEKPIGEATVPAVDARELHTFLDVRRDFTTWIKDRLATYGFTEGVDFMTFQAGPQNGGAGNRGIRTEYVITLDTAKELSMVERNDKGRQARRYFIECERRAKLAQPAPLSVPQSLPEALRLAADLAEKVEAQKAEIAVLGPRSEALAVIADADGAASVTVAAKCLQMPPGELWAYLRRAQWVYKRDRDGIDVAYQAKITAGYLTHKIVNVPVNGRIWAKPQVCITPRGLTVLAARIPLDRPGGLFGTPIAPASA